MLEANHDLDRLWRGPYPPALKRRVGGPRGHLSNGAAARLARTLAETGRPRAIWLAHLSAVNNAPALAHAAVAGPLARDAADHCTVAVAARDRPSLVWHSPPAGLAVPPRPRPARAAAPAPERAPAQLELPF